MSEKPLVLLTGFEPFGGSSRNRSIEVAREHPVEIVRGDLVDEIEPLLARVPAGLRRVVIHTAVLAYLPTERRDAFAATMAAHPEVVWLANEGAEATAKARGNLK